MKFSVSFFFTLLELISVHPCSKLKLCVPNYVSTFYALPSNLLFTLKWRDAWMLSNQKQCEKKKLKSSQFGVWCWDLSQVIVQQQIHTKKGKNQYSGPSIYMQSQWNVCNSIVAEHWSRQNWLRSYQSWHCSMQILRTRCGSNVTISSERHTNIK